MSSVPTAIKERLKADMGLIALAEASRADIERNRQAIERGRGRGGDPKTCIWFVPEFSHVLKGGLRTIFAAAERMTQRWGTRHTFVVFSFTGRDFDAVPIEKGLATHFPSLAFSVRKFLRGAHDVADLPEADIGVCTLWTTAYLLLKHNKVSRKYYFLQDFEPVFYAGGSVSAVIEATYRFGFTCIANSYGVAQCYRRYSHDVTAFAPGLDLDVFHPPTARPQAGPRRVVFYGRPTNDRNAFGLGLDVLRRVKAIMGDGVVIQSVGAAWDEAEFDVEGVIENLGLLQTLQEVGDLYREADLGLVFMLSAHPSYQPLEYMGCEAVVATNVNEHNAWLLQHDRNCVALNPVPGAAAEEITALLADEERMARLKAGGRATVAALSWDRAYDVILGALAGDKDGLGQGR